MNDSASTSGIEQRKRRTRRALTKHARRLTIDHGLHGFTVEQVCELAGVSRRTFFNYFASKEEAIVGPPDGSHHEAFDAFRAARPGGATGLSASLVDDLVALAVELIGEFDDVDEFDDPRLVIAREPQLLGAFIGAGATADREFAELVGEREGLPAGGPADPQPDAPIWASLQSLDIPITLIRAESGMVSEPLAAEWREHLPGSTVITLAGPHNLHEAAPRELAAVLRESGAAAR